MFDVWWKMQGEKMSNWQDSCYKLMIWAKLEKKTFKKISLLFIAGKTEFRKLAIPSFVDLCYHLLLGPTKPWI